MSEQRYGDERDLPIGSHPGDVPLDQFTLLMASGWAESGAVPSGKKGDFEGLVHFRLLVRRNKVKEDHWELDVLVHPEVATQFAEVLEGAAFRSVEDARAWNQKGQPPPERGEDE